MWVTRPGLAALAGLQELDRFLLWNLITITPFRTPAMAALNPLPPAGALLLGTVTGALRITSDSIWPGLLAHVINTELTLVAPGLP